MTPLQTAFPPIAGYIDTLSGDVRDRIASICHVVESVAPQAEGRISYHMPAYFLDGSLVYFSAFQKHIGFFPASVGVFEAFRDELSAYPQSGRGTVQFPHKVDLPLELIRRMVEFRVAENLAKGIPGPPHATDPTPTTETRGSRGRPMSS